MPPEARVGIVEDGVMFLKYARDALVESGHTVVFEAIDLASATRSLDEVEEAPDVILVDSTFPRDSSSEAEIGLGAIFSNRVQDKFPGTTIVMFSSTDQKPYGHIRFPPKGKRKGVYIIYEELGSFVTGLPPRA